MSNFPNSFDDDTTLPFVNDNITEVGEDAINALRDAVFAIEQNIGLGAAGTAGSLAARIGILINPDGTPNYSTITSLGLVTLPITNSQIANNAGIPESKLRLDYRTADLYNYILNLQGGLNTALGWIATTGIQLEPHILGALYQHTLAQILVSTDQTNFPFLLNNLRLPRNNSNGYTLVNDINSEFLAHQWADGSTLPVINTIVTNDQSTYPSNYGHTASGIFLNTARFTTVPQTANDMQQFAQFMDSSGIFLLGTRLQNLYSNGVSRESRSSSLTTDGYGSPLVPLTPAIAYLKNNGTSSSPVDDINTGDDIIEFKPSAANQSSNVFDAQFALVKIGDVVRVNYGTIEVPFVIREKKYIASGGNKKYIVRIAGKNLQYSANAIARIDRPLFNNNKYGVLAVAAANIPSTSVPASLIVGSPRGAQALGIGFDPGLLDASHYLLYLALYPDGNPNDGYVILPPIDVTGNQGTTAGLYTLDSVVAATNNAFRQPGFNYRFIAFEYQGEFGIMLADSYNNAGFSIVNGVVNSNGFFDQTATTVSFLNNVVGLFPVIAGGVAPDPLGFGTGGANIASPPFQTSYGSAAAAILPTKVFLPLKRNNFYVNGTEREKLSIDVGQIIDGYGDGYWIGTIVSQTIIPGPMPIGRVETTYNIPIDLSASQLKVGKTLVVQSFDGYGTSPTDFGRFIIQTLSLPCGTGGNSTQITVYDAVHGTGVSPVPTLGIGAEVAIYFNSDSVSINQENASDFSVVSPFNRHIEVYVDGNSNTFTQERGRFYIGNSSPLTVNGNVPLFNYSELAKLNLIKISPKLRGYQFGSVTKITLNMVSFDSTTGIFDGYLSAWDGVHGATNIGPTITGKKGEVARFYDETNIDYIDILFDINIAVASFAVKQLDIQLFPTLSLDNEQMLIATCQYNDISTTVSYVRDERQFGNIGVKELSTSALQFLSLGDRLLHGNGVIRGLDLSTVTNNPNSSQVYLMGGEVLVNGNFIQLNANVVNIPPVSEFPSFPVNWLLCVNTNGEYQTIPLLDFDPDLGTPNNPTRIFQALNLATGQNYFLDASTFSDVVNKRKDLVPLYIVASAVAAGTPPTVNLGISDTRKFVNDGDTNLPLRLTSSQSQGNFRSVAPILNWIKYNSLFNGTASVNGATVDNATINEAVTLDFISDVVIDGQDNATLVFNEDVTFGSHVTIKNLTMTINSLIAVLPNASNLSFRNCSITVNVPGSPDRPPPNNVVFDILNANNINFQNCFINIVFAQPYDNTQVFRGSVFRLTQSGFTLPHTSAFNMDSCILTVSYNISPGVFMPGNVFTIVNHAGVTISNSTFSGNYNQFVNNSGGNSLTLENLTLNSTYNPNAGVTPDSYGSPPVSYSSSDFVNSGQGYIYVTVGSKLTNMLVNNVVFNYLPAVSANDRYSFINIEFPTSNSTFSNLTITNCSFNHLNVSSGIDDYRAAISIINTTPTTGGVQQPILSNANISQNICNRSQSIIMTSVTNSGVMTLPGLKATNCFIDSNTCGSIGYWVSIGYKVVNTGASVNAFTDKEQALSITNNNCHYIYNSDSTGHYWMVSKIISGATVNQSKYPSGYVRISSNRSNWIHVGVAFEEQSSLRILDNNLSAYDASYLNLFNDAIPNAAYNPNFPSVPISPGYAIFVSANKHTNPSVFLPGEGGDSSCVISGNVTETGYWSLNPLLAPQQFQYATGYIYCQASAQITNNTLRGIAPGPVLSNVNCLILLGGRYMMVTNNKVYRSGNVISHYIRYAQFELPFLSGSAPSGVLPNGSETNGIIKFNFFDSFNTNNAVTAGFGAIDFSLASGAFGIWNVGENINQIGLYEMMVVESLYEIADGSPISPGADPPPFATDPGAGTGPFIITNPYLQNVGLDDNFIGDATQNGVNVRILANLPTNGTPNTFTPQRYRRTFVINNYIPYGTARINQMGLIIKNYSTNGVTFDSSWDGGSSIPNHFSITITNLNSGVTQFVEINPDNVLQTLIGTAGVTYFLVLGPTITAGSTFGGTNPIYNPSNFYLSAPISVTVDFAITAKLTGASGATDWIGISPLVIQYIW